MLPAHQAPSTPPRFNNDNRRECPWAPRVPRVSRPSLHSLGQPRALQFDRVGPNNTN